MSLTPKETGGGIMPVYPVDIAYSGLLEAGYSSSGAVAANATLVLSFKPTVVNTAYPLCDPTNHYMLMIAKVGTTVEVFRNAVSLGTHTTSATTYAGLLSEALITCCGSDHGYYSNMYVVDGEALSWGTFFDLSARVANLWVWKKSPAWTDPGPNGGRYTFSDARPVSNAFVGGTPGGNYSNGLPPAALFDASNATLWDCSGYGTADNFAWYDFGAGVSKTLAGYFVSIYDGAGATAWPWGWDILGSNDSTDGCDGTWATVDSVRGRSDLNTYGAGDTFICSDPGAYRWYKFQFVEGNYAFVNSLGTWHGYESFGLGTDYSGKRNHWTVTGVQSLDTPTNNHPVLNPLFHTAHALADGNLSFTGDAADNITPATMACFDGCYWEVEWTMNSGAACGVAALANYVSGRPVASSSLAGNEEMYRFDGTLATSPLLVGNASTIGMAYRYGKLWYSVDGVWIGDPAADVGATDESIVGTVYPFWFDRWGSNVPQGCFRFSESDLAYPPPTGFSPLNAMNAPSPLVTDYSRFAELVVRTGTGTDDGITSLDFPPDWVNTKQRDSARSWLLKDRVRGDGKWLSTDTADAEGSSVSGAGSFTVDGYTTGNGDMTNILGGSFIDLCLKAGPAGGLAVVAYTGDGIAGRQLAHGLGKAPAFMIVRRLDGAGSDWTVYHKALGATRNLTLNKMDAAIVLTNRWNDTEPTAIHFTVGNGAYVNADGDRFVAYLFADSDVFRAFSYMGNANTDGPAVDLGGRVLSVPFLKNSGAAQSWSNQDAVRDPANVATSRLAPNEPDAEASDGGIAFISSGMKITSSGVVLNGSGNLHVGLAVLAQPNKYSNAF